MSVDIFPSTDDLSLYDIRANCLYQDDIKISNDSMNDIGTSNDFKVSDDSMDDIKTSDDSIDDVKISDESMDDLKISDDSINNLSSYDIRAKQSNFPLYDIKKRDDDDTKKKDDSIIRLFKRLQIIDLDKVKVNKGMWYKGIYINNFNIYKVTTTTMIVELNKKNNEKVVFHLLPITKILLNKKRGAAKCELPRCDVPGSIIALKHYDQVRGIIKSEKKGFKHSISIDISTSLKNINVQLSSLKMKICGSPSEDGKLGLEAAELVINHIENIQNMINKIKSNRDIAERTINWVVNNTKGEKILREHKIHKGKLIISNQIEDFTIIYPRYFIPDELDIDIARFLISLINDFVYYSDMCEKINSMLNVPDVITIIDDEPLRIQSMNFVMVNYNYHLFFNINLESLDTHIHGKNNFYSHYNNDLSNCVTIELAYDPSINPAIKRKKNKIPRITFLCYKSGSITLSGPGSHIMAESYYLFMITIAEIKHLIESK